MRILDDKPEIWPYILLSLLVHALVLVVIPKSVKPPAFKEEPIEVFALDKLPEFSSDYRIADIPEPSVQRRPKTAKFLGRFDSSTDNEMVGVNQKPGKMGDGAKPKFKTRIGSRSQPVQRPGIGKDRLFAFNKNLFSENAPKKELDAENEAHGGPGGALDDFYPDFKRGAHTYLNVMRYDGVEYFVRLKRAFKIAFNPEPSLQSYFSRNQVARGSVDVVLGVCVNKGGDLAELFVFRSSGIPDYDEEALRTVRVSAPFSTPPDKFLEEDGLLRMSWTFSVYL